MQKASIGRTVMYTLNKSDVTRLNDERTARKNHGLSTGNQAWEGNTFPMVMVHVHPHDSDIVNGQVLMDGPESLWVTAVSRGKEGDHGVWSWPFIKKGVSGEDKKDKD